MIKFLAKTFKKDEGYISLIYCKIKLIIWLTLWIGSYIYTNI